MHVCARTHSIVVRHSFVVVLWVALVAGDAYLEVSVVDSVEANETAVQFYVDLCHLISAQIAVL